MLNIKCVKNYISDGNEFKEGKIYKAERCGNNDYYLFLDNNKIWLDFEEEDIKRCFE